MKNILHMQISQFFSTRCTVFSFANLPYITQTTYISLYLLTHKRIRISTISPSKQRNITDNQHIIHIDYCILMYFI